MEVWVGRREVTEKRHSIEIQIFLFMTSLGKKSLLVPQVVLAEVVGVYRESKRTRHCSANSTYPPCTKAKWLITSPFANRSSQFTFLVSEEDWVEAAKLSWSLPPMFCRPDCSFKAEEHTLVTVLSLTALEGNGARHFFPNGKFVVHGTNVLCADP